jgi:hypothetical protein
VGRVIAAGLAVLEEVGYVDFADFEDFAGLSDFVKLSVGFAEILVGILKFRCALLSCVKLWRISVCVDREILDVNLLVAFLRGAKLLCSKVLRGTSPDKSPGCKTITWVGLTSG